MQNKNCKTANTIVKTYQFKRMYKDDVGHITEQRQQTSKGVITQ